MKIKKNNRGVTLVEIAIVLVIIGLLLGGILKGQELINNAKVRAIADRQNSLKVAWFAFLDRFQALPGDFSRARQYIPGAANGAGDGTIGYEDSVLVFQHLTAAGYLRCSTCTATASATSNSNNSVINSYGGIMSIWSDSDHYAFRGASSTLPRLLIHTGPRIPSNIIQEVDQKIDDGIGNGGDFTFNNFNPVTGGQVPLASLCLNTIDATGEGAVVGDDLNSTSVLYWRSATQSPPVVENCGASLPI